MVLYLKNVLHQVCCRDGLNSLKAALLDSLVLFAGTLLVRMATTVTLWQVTCPDTGFRHQTKRRFASVVFQAISFMADNVGRAVSALQQSKPSKKDSRSSSFSDDFDDSLALIYATFKPLETTTPEAGRLCQAVLFRKISFILGMILVAGSLSAGLPPAAKDGTLTAMVLDASGAAISGASISVQCGPFRTVAQSDQNGTVSVPLKQSTCTITTTAKGFAPASQVVDVSAQQTGDLTIVLQVSGSSSAITVNSQQDAVDVSKIDANPMDLPLAIESVPAQLVADQGFTRLLDVVRNVSGVTSKEAYMGVTDTFNIRGFDASSSLFNGFRRDYYGTVNDVSSLERVEVIKGPSSVTEGFLEPGGIVNVVTKRPLPDFLSSFDVMYGTLGTGRGQFDVNIPFTSRLSLRATGAQEHRGSFRDYVHNDLNSVGLALNWTPGSRTLLEARFYNTYLNGVPDRGFPIYALPFSSILALPDSRFLGQPQDRYRQRNTNISETLRQGLAGSWSLRAGANFFQLSDYRNNTEVDGPDAQFANLLDRELTIVPGNSSTVNAVMEVAGDATTFGVHHHLTGGVDYQRLYSYNYFTENFNEPLFNPFSPNHGDFDRTPGDVTYWYYGYTYDTGTYVQDLMTFGRHFRILAGARQDEFTYHDHELVGQTMVRLKQGAFSPRVGLVYQPVSALSFYANYASSFNPQQGVVLLNGQDPKPSRGKQVEAGVKWNATGRLTATADVFRIRKTNVATGVPGNSDFSQLTGEEQSQGFEFDSTFTVRRGLVVRANLADIQATVIADTQIAVGSILINVPRWQGGLWAEGEIPHTPLSAGFGWFAVGQREATLPNGTLVPRYNRFDASLYWKLGHGLKLQANVQNISNVRYFTSQDYLLYPGSPINALLSIHWTPQHRH